MANINLNETNAEERFDILIDHVSFLLSTQREQLENGIQTLIEKFDDMDEGTKWGIVLAFEKIVNGIYDLHEIGKRFAEEES